MKTVRAAMAVALMFSATPAAFAGIYTDDLSRCLVEKTTAQDKTVLVQWIFVAMAQHPSVSALTKTTADDVEAHNKSVGALFMKLLTETCLETSQKALKNEGSIAIQSAFQVLGQAAAREIFAAPEVNQVMSGLEKYIDAKKLEVLSK
jgi:hypothetical protein